ncbi:putative methyltransferase protein [Rhypophila decipiens]
MASSDSSQGKTWSFLGGDAQELVRPVAQHEWLKELLAFDMHPAIPIPAGPPAEVGDNTEPFRIADVATGTAVWLLQVHKALPTAPFPEEYHGTFDIVAMRLIAEGLRGSEENGDWGAAVKNVTALLKPGGHLHRPCGYGGGVSNQWTRHAIELFLKGYMETLFPGPLLLTGLCKLHGLNELTLEVYPTDHYSDFQEMRRQGVSFLAGSINVMMDHIVDDDEEETPEKNGGTAGETEAVAWVKWTKERVEEVVKEAREELQRTEALFLRWEMQVIVARKPTV